MDSLVSSNVLKDVALDCTSCSPGYYKLNITSLECRACPSGCTECTSYSQCTGCKPGYLNINTECRSCPFRCTTCTTDIHCTGCIPFAKGDVCENCVDGHYGSKCHYSCRGRCKACTDYDLCQECKEGFYNRLSSPTVTNCGLTSPPCPSNCETCVSDTECTKCKNYFYNTDMLRGCSLGCPDHCVVCESDTSCSVCEANFDGNVCQNCVVGKHGNNCDEDCPDECRSCTSDSQCMECKSGYYKINTECRACPSRCKTCIFERLCTACIQNAMGNVCDGCVEGYYGQECDKRCPNNCNNNICSYDGNACLLGCTTGYRGIICAEAATNSLPFVVGVVVGGIVAIAIVVSLSLIFVKYKRMEQNRKQSRSDHELETPSNNTDNMNLDDSPGYNSVYDSMYDSIGPPQGSQLSDSRTGYVIGRIMDSDGHSTQITSEH